MSGGEFNYSQCRITEIAYDIEQMFETEYFKSLEPETQQEFRNGVYILKKAFIYAQRIDWLVSGDDGEDTFHCRIAEDLDYLNKNEKCNVCCSKVTKEKCDNCGIPNLMKIEEPENGKS